MSPCPVPATITITPRFYFIGRKRVLPICVTIDLQLMAIKGYSKFPKVSGLKPSSSNAVQCHIQDTRCRGMDSYPSAKML